MAQSSVGKGALVLTTNNTGLDIGLAQASAKIKSFGASVAGSLKSMALPAIGGIIAGFGLGALEKASEKIKQLAGIGRTAKGLGIDSAQFMGLQGILKQTGLEADKVNLVLLKIGHATTQAANGSKPLADAFNRIGIDANQLKGQALDQQFIGLLDAFSKLPAGAARSELAVEIFGKQAGHLAPLLSKSREEIQAFIDQLKSEGNALSQSDMEKITAAQKAQAKIHRLWEGFSNKIAVALTPVMEFIGSKMQQAGSVLGETLSKAARAAVVYWEVFGEVLKEAWDYLKEIGKQILDLDGSFGDLKDQIGTVEEITFAFLKGMGMGFGYVIDSFKVGAGLIVAALGKITQGIGWTMEQMGKLLDKLKQLPESVKPSWLNGAIDAFKDGATATKEMGKGMVDEGLDAWNHWGESAERYGKWFDGMQKKNKKAAQEMVDDIEEAADAMKAQYVAINPMEKGSAAAASFEAKFRAGTDGDIHKQNNKELKDANKKLQKIADSLEGQDMLKVA